MQGSAQPTRATIREPKDLASLIDHTLLRADATEKDVIRLCEEARVHAFKAVCVNPNFVAKTRELLGSTAVLTAAVVGFPLGANRAETKARETELALKDGAAEIDMVMRLDLAKEGRWSGVEEDIHAVVLAAGSAPVKVILETGLLTPDEIAEACRASSGAGAAFVKTATGFLSRGATIEDVKLMRQSSPPEMQIKASGGIKTFAQAAALVAAGADRLGTSMGVYLVTGAAAPSGY